MKLASGEHEVVLNGIRIHYTVRGSGPALIALSGGPGADARIWDDYAKIDEFVTVIAMHPRGSGLSDSAPGDAYALTDYVADVKALMDHLGLDKPILMGWSHGGMVAQQFAFTHPDSLSRLILYDTSACNRGFLSDVEAAVQRYKHQPWYGESLMALKKALSGDVEGPEELASLLEHTVKFYFYDLNEQAVRYLERIKNYPARSESSNVFTQNEAMTMDLRPRLKEIRVPTLVIVGRYDFITNVAMAEEIANNTPDSRLEIFEKSGHFAIVEEPEKFHNTIKHFIMDA